MSFDTKRTAKIAELKAAIDASSNGSVDYLYEQLSTAQLSADPSTGGSGGGGATNEGSAYAAGQGGSPILLRIVTPASPPTYSEGDLRLASGDLNGAVLVNIDKAGQQLAADSVPVVLPALQIAAITKIGTISNRTDVASSATSGTLLAGNLNRKTVAIANDSTSILYILYGNTAAASSTNYTYVLQPITSSIPSILVIEDYSGIVTGVWASANGFARITEVI